MSNIQPVLKSLTLLAKRSQILAVGIVDTRQVLYI